VSSSLSPRLIPAIEQLRLAPGARDLEARYGRDALVDALRAEAAILRDRLATGRAAEAVLPSTPAEATGQLVTAAAARLARILAPSLRRVINATGVIIHTNLGRAPLSDRALQHLTEVAKGYSTLEYDLDAGTRGRRDLHAEALLTRLTGAEAAVVVNNNAAATLLLLTALAGGREVVISRGELVEIGGGFRVPDVMAQSGAILREVGTTNRTRVADYAAALGERTALILRVHPSNFRLEGFTERPALGDLAALARAHRLPLMEDLGSGYLGVDLAGAAPALRDEPRVSDSLAAGVDVVCFSGDKLLGGPQAGIIAGRRALVDIVRRHPLMRALRVDKLTYGALEGTLLAWVSARATREVPVARMVSLPQESIAARAQRVADALRRDVEVALVEGLSTIGGGSAPGSEIPTCLLAITPRGRSADQFEASLRRLPTPVIARIQEGRVVLDLRTVAETDDEELVALLRIV
jgi:L-seryl-tRNA(Ser) seleniumtransferase